MKIFLQICMTKSRLDTWKCILRISSHENSLKMSSKITYNSNCIFTAYSFKLIWSHFKLVFQSNIKEILAIYKFFRELPFYKNWLYIWHNILKKCKRCCLGNGMNSNIFITWNDIYEYYIKNKQYENKTKCLTYLDI